MFHRVLTVKPDQTWLVVSDGAWAVHVITRAETVPLPRPRSWLLPLLERPRPDVEDTARQQLRPDDPELADLTHLIVETGLHAWSDYWIQRAMAWATQEDIGAFAGRIIEIAHDSRKSQATRHEAERLLLSAGLWQKDRRDPRSAPPA